MPFCLATDPNTNLVLWARVPLTGLTGALLAGLIDALMNEGDKIRDEIDQNP